jgi:deazaflavin-dependent oxidoreductase (nitroreductase family)
MEAALNLGVGPSNSRLLTVRGRRTGKEYTTPVNLVVRQGQTYLVSPYGERAWVRNARAAGRVSLARGRKQQTLRIEELSAPEAAPVLGDYWQQNPITRPFFDADPGDDAFEREAARHPVFRLHEA